MIVIPLLRKFECSSGAAYWLVGQTTPILNGIFYARLTYHSYHASVQVYDRALEYRLENIRAYLQILESPSLSHPTQQNDIKRRAALLYENIKHTAYSLSNTHPIRCNLYIIALFKQHQLNASFAITSANNKISEPVFQAVSWYTDESPQELYQLMISNSKKICADNPVESDNYPEAKIINTLAEILRRPICVVEGIAATNFFNSDFPKWNLDNFKVLRGDPIFIFYDTAEKKYHGLLARGELYLELQLEKKLTSKQYMNETGTGSSSELRALQARLSKLRDGMFRPGLVATRGSSISTQNASANNGSAQKNPELKFDKF